MEYSPTSFKTPSGNLIELFSKSIPFSTMESVIYLVPMDPYKVPSSETATGIFNSIDSRSLAKSSDDLDSSKSFKILFT